MSTATLRWRERRLRFAVPRGAVADFVPLLEAWEADGVRVEVVLYGAVMPTADRLVVRGDGLDAVVLAGSARFAPSTVLPGPFLDLRDGRRVPTAWLPLRLGAETRRFAVAAARVRRRARQRRTLAVLGQWHPRYLHLADRIEALLAGKVTTFRWTGDRIGTDEMVAALGTGLGLAVYVGHGRPVGWVGYHGVRARHFEQFDGEPLGGMVSLCCRTASRRRTSLSYVEALPLLGVTAASFGAITETRHTDNTRWAVGICDTLASGADTIGDLLVRAAPADRSASAPYRLVGDPLAPLASARSSAQRARAVVTFP